MRSLGVLVAMLFTWYCLSQAMNPNVATKPPPIPAGTCIANGHPVGIFPDSPGVWTVKCSDGVTQLVGQ